MPITLVIEMIEGQPVRVTGPLQDKNLCFRLLFEAALAIKDYDSTKVIVPPTGVPPEILTGGRGGRG